MCRKFHDKNVLKGLDIIQCWNIFPVCPKPGILFQTGKKILDWDWYNQNSIRKSNLFGSDVWCSLCYESVSNNRKTRPHMPLTTWRVPFSLRISTHLEPYPEYKELRMSQGELDSVYTCLDIQEKEQNIIPRCDYGLLKITLCLHGFIVVLFMILWLSKSHSSKDVTY